MPDHCHPPSSLAKLYQEQGKPDQALHAIDEAVKLAPKSERVHFLRGQILQRLGRTDEAEAEYQKTNERRTTGRMRENGRLDGSGP